MHPPEVKMLQLRYSIYVQYLDLFWLQLTPSIALENEWNHSIFMEHPHSAYCCFIFKPYWDGLKDIEKKDFHSSFIPIKLNKLRGHMAKLEETCLYNWHTNYVKAYYWCWFNQTIKPNSLQKSLCINLWSWIGNSEFHHDNTVVYTPCKITGCIMWEYMY